MTTPLGAALLVIAAAGPAGGDRFHLPFLAISQPPPPATLQRGFDLPRHEYVPLRGRTELQQGLIAGVPISSDAVVGLGTFGSRSRASILAPDGQTEKSRRKRKLALGLRMRF